MKLEDYRKKYYEASAKTSELVRQLGFVGIAVIWIFREEVNGKVALPPQLSRAGILITIALAFDLLHYASRTLIWGVYTWWKEKQGIGRDKDFKAPRQINWLAIFFFTTKTLAMVWAYLYLIRFLYPVISGNLPAPAK